MNTKINKKYMDKRIRTGLLIFLILIFLFSLNNLIQAFQIPDTIEEKVSIAGYEQKSSFNYVVILKPSSLYDTSTLGPGKTYFTEIVDRIDTLFLYEFRSDQPVGISGNYEVTAIVRTELWEKNFTVVPEKDFSGTSFNVSLPLTLTPYNEVVSSIGNEIGVQAKEPKLELLYKINTTVIADDKQVKETLTTTVIIPLQKKSFEIGGDLSSSKPGSIMKTEQVLQENVVKNRIYSSAVTILILLIFLLVRSRTENIHLEINKMEEKIAKIQKKYGDWIADVKKLPKFTQEQIFIPLKSMEDLIKVAEELGRPVIHVRHGGNHYYCILDGQTCYEYTIAQTTDHD